MLIRGTAIILATLFVAAAPIRGNQSHQPTPRAAEQRQAPINNGQGNQNSAAPNQDAAKQRTTVGPALPPVEAQKPPAAQSAEQYPETHEDWWIIIPTIFVAGFTGLLFLYTAKLWSTTKSLVGEERENSCRELRAYILTKSSDVRISPPAPPMLGMLAAGYKPYALVELKNFGKTPAYDFRSLGNVVITTWPINSDALPTLDETIPSSSDFLGPDDSRVPEYRGDFNFVLTEWDILLLEEGALAIVVYGKVHYRDAFGNKWTTNFRKFAGGPIGLRPTSNKAGNLLAGHGEGNKETKNDW